MKPQGLLAAFLLAGTVLYGAPACAAARDVMLVLDNSGSMKKNDPEFLMGTAVTQFIRNLKGDVHAGMIIFDQSVRLAVPLMELSDASRPRFLESLHSVNYKGLFTDSPAAMERAIYELKMNGRPDAERSIVFITDGIVDTGDKQRDFEKDRWMRDTLTADARDAGIRIFSIAFTNEADFQLIQSLAQKTGGEYYRAFTAAEIPRVFDRINTAISRSPPAAVPETATATMSSTPPEPEPAPAAASPPPQPSPSGGSPPGAAPAPEATVALPPLPGEVTAPSPAVEGQTAQAATKMPAAENPPGESSGLLPAPPSSTSSDFSGSPHPSASRAATETPPQSPAVTAAPAGAAPGSAPETGAAAAPAPASSGPRTGGGGQEALSRALSATPYRKLEYAGFALLLLAVAAGWYRRRRGRASASGAAPRAPKAFLNDLDGMSEKKSYELTDRLTVIGRLRGAAEQDTSYVVIDQPTIGRRHAMIEYKDHSFWVVDQSSLNGTFVNNRRLEGEHRLKHGDHLKFHKHEFEFIMLDMFETDRTMMSNTAYGKELEETPDDDVTQARVRVADRPEPSGPTTGR